MRSIVCVLLILFAFFAAYLLKRASYFNDKSVVAGLALNTMRESVVLTDSNNRIVYINPAYTYVTGYTEHEVMGKNPSITGSGKQGKEFYKKMWDSLQQSGRWEGEVWNRRKSGELYAEWLSITVIRGDRGKAIYYLGVFTDITLRKLESDQLLHYAYYDPLTDLPNRRFFRERLEQAIKVANRNKTKLAVLFVDLDRFKPVNDNYGHQAGDFLLCEVAKNLRSQLRDTDTLARIGGDEFVVLLPEIQTRQRARVIADKLFNHLKSLTIRFETASITVSSSVGGVVYPDDAVTAADLIKLADEAMYQVKTTSRNAVKFYEKPGS
jgi:diguanylate cyclase (GGDEF)-like protein/PAS domain S-box-containing protein